MTDERWQQVKALFQATLWNGRRPSAPRSWLPLPVAMMRCVVKSSRCSTSDAAGTGILDRLPIASEALLAEILYWRPDRRRWCRHRRTGSRPRPTASAPTNRGRAAWRRRHGRSLQGARHAARPHRRDQGPAGARRARSSSARTLRARSARRRRAEPSAHLHAARRRAVRMASTSW